MQVTIGTHKINIPDEYSDLTGLLDRISQAFGSAGPHFPQQVATFDLEAQGPDSSGFTAILDSTPAGLYLVNTFIEVVSPGTTGTTFNTSLGGFNDSPTDPPFYIIRGSWLSENIGGGQVLFSTNSGEAVIWLSDGSPILTDWNIVGSDDPTGLLFNYHLSVTRLY